MNPSEWEGLLDFACRIDEQLELHHVAALTTETAARLLGSDAARLSLVDPFSGVLGQHWETPGFPSSIIARTAIQTALDSARQRQALRPAPIASTPDWFLLCVPVVTGSRMLGTLLVASSGAPVSEGAEKILGQLAAQAGGAIVRALRFKAFRDISEATVRSIKVHHALESVFRELEERGFEFATISAVDEYRGVIETLRGMNVRPEWTRRARHLLASEDMQAHVVRTRQTEVVKGFHERFDSSIHERYDHDNLGRVLVPIVAGNDVVGTIETGCRLIRSDAVLTRENVAAVEEIARRYAQEVAQARPFVLLKLIAGHAIEVLGADSASLHVYENGTEFLVAGAGKATANFLRRFAPRPGGIGRLAMDTGETQIRVANELASSHSELWHAGVQAMVAVPLLVERSVRGVLYVHFWQPHDFTPIELEVVKVLARHMEVAIQNSQLMRGVLETSERAWTFARLQNVIQDMASGVQLREVLDNIAQTVLYAFRADNVTLYQYFEDEDKFIFPPVMKGDFRHPESMHMHVRPDDIVWKTVGGGLARFTADVSRDTMLSGPRTDGVEKPRFVDREEITSSAALVMRSESEKLGMMFVNFRSPHTFTLEEKTAMNALASSAAIAIRSVRLRERVDREASRRLAALEAMKAVLDQVALQKGDVEQQVLDLTLEKALQIVGARVGFIMWYSAARRRLESRSIRGLSSGHPTIVQGKTEGVIGLAVETRKSILVPDVTDERWRKIYKCVFPDTRSELAIPLVEETGVLGVLNLEDPDPRRFSEEDRALLEALAVQAASAIHSVRLYARLERQIQPLNFLGLIATRSPAYLDARLRLLLTGVTAKQGLGFSRAMLFLLDARQTRLEGFMGIGARTSAEARRVWNAVEKLERESIGEHANLPQALLDHAERLSEEIRAGRLTDSDFSLMIRSIALPVDEKSGALAQCIREDRTIIVDSDRSDPLREALDERAGHTGRARPFACVPIAVGGGPIGALVVDNAFLPSQFELDPEAVANLDAFAEIAGLSIAHDRLEGLKQWRTFMHGAGHLFGSRIAGTLARSSESCEPHCLSSRSPSSTQAWLRCRSCWRISVDLQ